MSTSAWISALISLGITWGGFGVCLTIASRKKDQDN